jgi:DNA-binding MarR family transcriptional regulator
VNDKPIAFTLIHAAHLIEGRLEEALATVNLSGPKFAALSALVGAGESLSMCDLAGKLTCVRSNCTQLVDRLEADGLVRRVEDPKDRRAVRAEVTALGRERQAAGAKKVAAVHQQLNKQLSGVNAELLNAALASIQ